MTCGFAGIVYAVNPHARSLEGVPCVASVDDLPEAVDLAVIAVPPAAVPDVTTACGRNGVRALTVITSGLGAEGVGLLAMCRRYGMRLAGPNWGASGNHSGRDHGFLPRLPGGGRRR